MLSATVLKLEGSHLGKHYLIVELMSGIQNQRPPQRTVDLEGVIWMDRPTSSSRSYDPGVKVEDDGTGLNTLYSGRYVMGPFETPKTSSCRGTEILPSQKS